ncbi:MULTISPECIES: flagellar protein FlaG [Pseudomonas]|uniref:Flagellar biosynthesis protein FlaG n=1 Tax=Pseudomonas poae TaxID=200451 RepID=A0AAP2S4K2_9PSED|nr:MULTISPECIES: flagellar protein FlaG [Pseudomonas]ELQ18961.1 putative flagellin-like protein [Pseudomonas fluorescens BRIP34879]KTC27464.1 flagellar biosynthesis protein FlaG [Pseudomonas sp. ABAC21]AGE26697.1 putative flagellin-like protein [Pseudomonas poae RE*1-1-14]KRP51757.1 flagellar protein FlaG [Pseudomonas poae]MBC3199713.1 flagellar protein FlaG [Pseudomonas poae]
MDMSVKLASSYPPVAPQSAPAALVADKDKTKVEAIAPIPGKPERADLEQAVTDIREFVQAAQRKLDFSIDDSTHRVVVKVIATDSGEVIRQIPSETALKLAQNLANASHVLFDEKV